MGASSIRVRLDAKKDLEKGRRAKRAGLDPPKQKRRGGPVRLGDKPRHPVGVIAEVQRRLTEVARRSHAAIVDSLIPKLPEGTLEREAAWKLAREISEEQGVSLTEAKRMASSAFDATDKFNRRDVARTIGIRAPEFSSKKGDAWREKHVGLIKSLSTESRDWITGYLKDVGERGTRVEVLRKRLEEAEGMSFRRARLVARDQVLSLNAELTRDRHKAAGITQYSWLTIKDGSSRSNHEDLDGQVFSYDDPPLGGGTGPDDYGHPGDGIGCRCQTIPVISEFEES